MSKCIPTVVRRSKLVKAAPGKNSLRTTVPNAYVEYLNLSEGEDLNWETGEHDGKRFLVVTKASEEPQDDVTTTTT